MTLADYLKPEIYNRGIEHGIEKGIEKGVQQGLEQGKAEGKVERNVEIAQNMLSMGMDLNIISSATGLSSQEIKGLYS